jgi:hypothetical protein
MFYSNAPICNVVKKKEKKNNFGKNFSQLYPFPKQCLLELLMENISFAFSSCFVTDQHNAN